MPLDVPKRAELRPKWFYPDEQVTILRAALAITDTRKPFNAARRFVPWLCAYTGARAGEITQLRGRDVIQEEGVWALRITPDAGTQKTNTARLVPLHEHLIAQGFVSSCFVREAVRCSMILTARTRQLMTTLCVQRAQEP